MGSRACGNCFFFSCICKEGISLEVFGSGILIINRVEQFCELHFLGCSKWAQAFFSDEYLSPLGLVLAGRVS